MLNILKRFLLIKKGISSIRYDSGKAFGSIYDENNSREISQLTSLDIINHDTEKTYFKSYSEVGFTMSNNFKIIGACTALPKAVLFWNVLNIEDVNEESLELISVLEPKLDILIIGKGPRNAKPDYKSLLQLSKKLKINFEILPTAEALSTFNFLNYEDRNVAAFLLPAKSFSYDEEDKAQILRLRNKRMELFNNKQRDLLSESDSATVNAHMFFPKQIVATTGKPDRVGDAIKKIIAESKEPKHPEIDTDKDKKQIE